MDQPERTEVSQWLKENKQARMNLTWSVSFYIILQVLPAEVYTLTCIHLIYKYQGLPQVHTLIREGSMTPGSMWIGLGEEKGNILGWQPMKRIARYIPFEKFLLGIILKMSSLMGTLSVTCENILAEENKPSWGHPDYICIILHHLDH